MKAIAVLVAVLAGLACPAGHAADVDLQLVLAADVSRSIDDGEFELQRKGYAAAMSDPRVLRAIAAGNHHAIAIAFLEWAGPAEQRIIVDWTIVSDKEAAAGIAETMLAAPRSFVGRTAIGEAIDFAMRRFAAAAGKSGRRIIDISGDGTSNAGRTVGEARDAAVAAGVTINGLAIVNPRSDPGFAYHTHPPGGLPKYYRDNVIGGSGAFLLDVVDFASFSEAMTRKLVAEIAGKSNPRRLAAR